MFQQQVNRVQPQGKPTDYRTYEISRPPDTDLKWTCQEVGCLQWRFGFGVVTDEATEQGREQAQYIRLFSGRTFREKRGTVDGVAVTVFEFEPYQRCFQDHSTLPDLFVVRLGDWRPCPDIVLRQHTRPVDWVEDFGEHQQEIAERVEKYHGKPEKEKE